MSFNLENIPSQKGKIAIVTGANSGLGKEITIGLAKKEIKVIMACRNQSKAESAKAEIVAKVNSADIEIILLNLNSLKSVRNFSATFLAKYDRLDLLIENAGIMIPPLSKTEYTCGNAHQFGRRTGGRIARLNGTACRKLNRSPQSDDPKLL